MSQSSADNEGNSPPLRRGRRYKKASQKAESILNSGEAVPGISPDRDVGSRSSDRLPATSTAGDIAREVPIARAAGMASRGGSGGASAGIYGLGPDKFAIYFWKVPRPTDFLNLSNSRKRWKADMDRAESQKDIDDRADDWEEFDNNLADRGIASCFMKRAKRMYWAGKTWKEFEEQERNLKLQAFNGDGDAESYTLDNARRIKIFEALKERLCEEIWLQPYVGDQSSNNRKPAKAATRKPKIVTEHLEPNKEDRANGIVARTRNREGAAETWYAGETINPSGLQNMLQAYRADSMTEQGQSSQRNRLQQRIMPQAGYTSHRDTAHANTAAERRGHSLDSSTIVEERGRVRERERDVGNR